jgi:3-methyladenine DNA glycosylase AlkD
VPPMRSLEQAGGVDMRPSYREQDPYRGMEHNCSSFRLSPQACSSPVIWRMASTNIALPDRRSARILRPCGVRRQDRLRRKITQQMGIRGRTRCPGPRHPIMLLLNGDGIFAGMQAAKRVWRTLMTATEIVNELKALGKDSIKKVLLNHGIPEPCLGVKVEELKKIQKRTKKDYQLALDLYDTGIYDAMYLAGLIADESKMTRKDLQHWVANANCDAIGSTAVAWVAAESRHGRELGLEWIESTKEIVARTGWATLCSLVAIRDDADLDLAELKRLLQRVQTTIHDQPNSVKSCMNSFVIAVGTHVKALTDAAMKTAEKIGKVSVDMGDTACKVPYAPEYIQKAQKRGAIGKKRKMARC